MTRTEKIILVTGATGNQGGATAAHLLAGGWRVRALVRDLSGPAARSLAQAGAEAVAGDMGDRPSLDEAARGAYGVFSVQPAWDDPADSPKEIPLGRNVADAAHAAGARHLVYTSVAGAERGPDISHWKTKWEIEQHIRALGIAATILRPVQFMENYAGPALGVQTGELASVTPPDRPIQVIATDDIGAFAALAFADPGTYAGAAIEIAGDALPPPQIAAAIGESLGRTITYRPLSLATIEQMGAKMGANSDNLVGAVRFGEKGGWQADIPALRRLHPGLLDFRAWLEKTGRAKIQALLSARPA